MPTYDYVCDGCGHAFELFQSMTDSVKKTCPECRKKKLRRLIGAGVQRIGLLQDRLPERVVQKRRRRRYGWQT